MHLFWRRGYHEVSTRGLAEAMSINLNSLYAEFGSKEGLFSAAIEHYEQHMVPFYIGALERPDASFETIRDVLNAFPAYADTDGFVPGCLITNSATAHAPTPRAASLAAARYLDRLSTAYLNALTTTFTVDRARLVAAARLLTTTTLGLFVMLRAQTNRDVLQDSVDASLSQLEHDLNR
jgi:TetR/AcrR family transcriptional repressor of nem operon